MMVNSKNKGSAFERDVTKELNAKLEAGLFKRIAGSGAIGTVSNEPLLTGDVKGKIDGFPKELKIECKVGYGTDKSMSFKREWLNKIKKEAALSYGFPLVVGKFSGARKADGVQEFVAMDLEDFIYLMNFITNMSEELNLLYEKLGGTDGLGSVKKGNI